MGLPILGGIISAIGSIGKIIDDVVTSDEERLELKVELQMITAGIIRDSLGYEKALVESRAAIITAEATSKHIITSIWRPITMMTFLGIVAWGFFFDKEIPPDLWFLIKLGLGGYLGGRSAEKITSKVATALSKSQQA